MFKLVKPSIKWEAKFYAYLDEWIARNEKILPTVENPKKLDYVRWLDEEVIKRRDPRTCKKNMMPAHIFFFVRETALSNGSVQEDLIGMIEVRHNLSAKTLYTAGHVEYGIRPSQRGKGYGKHLISAAISIANQLGLKKILFCVDSTNEASRRLIRNAGGVYIDSNKQKAVVMERYYIFLDASEIPEGEFPMPPPLKERNVVPQQFIPQPQVVRPSPQQFAPVQPIIPQPIPQYTQPTAPVPPVIPQYAQPVQPVATVQPVPVVPKPVQPQYTPVQPIIPVAPIITPPITPVTPVPQPASPVQPVPQYTQPIQPVPAVPKPVQPQYAPVQPITPVAPVITPPITPAIPVPQPISPVQQPIQPVAQPMMPKPVVSQPVAVPVKPAAPVQSSLSQPASLVRPAAQPSLQPAAQLSPQSSTQPAPTARPVQPAAQPAATQSVQSVEGERKMSKLEEIKARLLEKKGQ